jgi:hypothetical protein
MGTVRFWSGDGLVKTGGVQWSEDLLGKKVEYLSTVKGLGWQPGRIVGIDTAIENRDRVLVQRLGQGKGYGTKTWMMLDTIRLVEAPKATTPPTPPTAPGLEAPKAGDKVLNAPKTT